MYAERLNRLCKMTVVEGCDGERVETGKVIVAPGDFQMQLKKDGRGYYVKCFKGEKVSGHMPSVDVLFDSVADTAGKNALGIILTGMGADGANGMLKMKQKGAYTIGQNKETCIVYGMPMEAFKKGGVDVQVPLTEISSKLYNLIKKKTDELNAKKGSV